MQATTIWLKLLQLPMEFYDLAILEKAGKKIGKLVMIYSCNSSTLKGRYVRISVQILVNMSVRTLVTSGSHKQAIIYEADNILCKACGRLGHIFVNCQHINIPNTATTSIDLTPLLKKTRNMNEELSNVSGEKR